MNKKNTSRSPGSPKPKERSRHLKGQKSKNRQKPKKAYRIRNWHNYNTALIQRGSLTLWLNQDLLRQWHSQERTGGRGRPRLYSDQAITCALRLKEVYRLPLRATEGLLRSLVVLLGSGIAVPSYSTLCRRRPALSVDLSAPAVTEPLHLKVLLGCRGRDGLEGLRRWRVESSSAWRLQAAHLA